MDSVIPAMPNPRGEAGPLLIVREILVGSTRINAIHRALPGLSRTLLSTRLRCLERVGVVDRLSGVDRPPNLGPPTWHMYQGFNREALPKLEMKIASGFPTPNRLAAISTSVNMTPPPASVPPIGRSTSP